MNTALSSSSMLQESEAQHLILRKMKKILTIRGRSKDRRNDGKTPLIKESNNNVQDGYDPEDKGYDTPFAQNTLNTRKEVAEHLNVAPDATSSTCEDDQCLIQISVSEHFPKLPTPDQNLNQHLVHVQEAVLHELKRLRPVLEHKELMEFLIDCYHRQTFDHLHSLLQNATSTQNSFVLMNWVLHIYQSEELLGHPDLQEMDPIKKVNHSLVSGWEAKAKAKLLENVQREVRQSLDKILQIEIGQEHCDPDEAYVGLYMDTIQCVGAKCNEAKKISSDLSDEVQDVCFQELLIFVRRYTTEQTEALGKKAEMDEPETIHFLKTLKTCKELKRYVQTTGKKNHLLMEMVEMLENMEASTLNLLMDIVTDIAESHLKKYFKSDRRRFCLCSDIEQYFPKLPYAFDEQQRVMDEAYKVIVGLYFKHLIQSNQKKLKKCWPDIGETVTEDAELLHNTISDLAPGVQNHNCILQYVTKILECNSIDAHKIEAAKMLKECDRKSEDIKRLLRWKGLSRREVQEVMDALPPDLQPTPDPDVQIRPDSDNQTRSNRSQCCCCACC
ncbi:exocyst complex component 3-like protein 4 isoform X3 [Lates calcarifer]|uniref:Exocyst complex component 3-like protein 4 isoform X2 n=1 Tax=Lates calcarifer TaxID=8187 RepID=A0AAJ8BKL0_LATCA|nr:exocyst complex component 3-like protein 4 isoform X2 [Lates calcarifer]XP_050934237.1 exocyst complex component 3-like protein 4 isoform X3 [Lates calcarifer]